MKRIVSVSLGSSNRDHRAEVTILGEKVIVERVGTDGNLDKAVELISSLDGKVDAFGLGGIDRYLVAGNRRYEIKDAVRLVKAARQTPVVDGSGLKNTLERRVVSFIEADLKLELKGKKVLMVSAVDRFGMAEAFSQSGCRMLFGDLIFALGLPVAITSLKTLQHLANAFLPVITRLPFKMLYPTGSKQEVNQAKYSRYYETADIIAGDFLYIKKYMPWRMDGKIIVTNTVTSADLAELEKRGVALLVTSTPEIAGRSFGTNVMEALLVSFSGKRSEELREEDYLQLLDRLGFNPRVVSFKAS
ncbi:MAG TPA: quinate 5-dehydrogenase [Bacillota bacterium]